jgi:anti-anti-sigma regulatory factor
MARTAITLDCGTLQTADAADVDQIARLHLGLRRQGCALRLRNPSSSLQELIGFCGLAAVLGVEPGRETEEGEQPGRVEEEGQLGDPSA